MKFLISTIFVLGLLNSCSERSGHSLTISPQRDYSFNDQTCLAKYKGMFSSLDFKISNYYELLQKIEIDKGDSIAIISPKLLSPLAEDCRNDEEPITNSRLLIVNIDGNKEVFKDLISNRIGIGTNGAELLKSWERGFILYKSLGGGCKFDYAIYIEVTGGNLTVKSIEYEYKCPNESNRSIMKSINYDKNKMPLEKLNRTIIDSLINNS